MATTIFADTIPKVKKRGDFTVLTFEFEGVETHLVLTSHAATASREVLERAENQVADTAEIIPFGV